MLRDSTPELKRLRKAFISWIPKASCPLFKEGVFFLPGSKAKLPYFIRSNQRECRRGGRGRRDWSSCPWKDGDSSKGFCESLVFLPFGCLWFWICFWAATVFWGWTTGISRLIWIIHKVSFHFSQLLLLTSLKPLEGSLLRIYTCGWHGGLNKYGPHRLMCLDAWS